MPVIFADAEAWEEWLDTAVDAGGACELLAPLAAERMMVRPASPVVNSGRDEESECLQRFARPPTDEEDRATWLPTRGRPASLTQSFPRVMLFQNSLHRLFFHPLMACSVPVKAPASRTRPWVPVTATAAAPSLAK